MNSFLTGFNMLDSVYKDKELQKDREEARAARKEEQEWRRTDRKRADDLRNDLVEAGKEPVVQTGQTMGLQGSRVFAADPANAAALAQNMAAEAEMRGEAAPVAQQATAVGREIFTDSSAAAAKAAAEGGQLGRVRRVGDAYGRAGMVAEQLRMEQLYKEMKKEGGIDALESALNPSMTEADIERRYNESGTHKVKEGTLKREFFDTEVPGFGKVKSARLTAEGADGKPIVIEDALAARTQFLPIERRMDMQAKGVEAGQRDRQINIQQQNADSTEKYRQDMAKRWTEELGLKKTEAERQSRQWAASHSLAQQKFAAEERARTEAGKPAGLAWKDVEPQLNRVGEVAMAQFGPAKDEPEEVKDKDGKVTRPREEKLRAANDATTAAGSLVRAAAGRGVPLTADEAIAVVAQGQVYQSGELVQRNAEGKERRVPEYAFRMPNGRDYPVGTDLPKRFLPQAGPPGEVAGMGTVPAPPAPARSAAQVGTTVRDALFGSGNAPVGRAGQGRPGSVDPIFSKPVTRPGQGGAASNAAQYGGR